MASIKTVQDMKTAICDKLKLRFGCSVEDADEKQMLYASALVLREIMSDMEIATKRELREKKLRQVHYLSMEFLSLIHI